MIIAPCDGAPCGRVRKIGVSPLYSEYYLVKSICYRLIPEYGRALARALGGRATLAVMDPAEGRECAPRHAAAAMARATYPHITI